MNLEIPKQIVYGSANRTGIPRRLMFHMTPSYDGHPFMPETKRSCFKSASSLGNRINVS